MHLATYRSIGLKKHRLAIRSRPGASGYAPGHAAETNVNTRSRVTTGAPSRRIETGSQR